MNTHAVVSFENVATRHAHNQAASVLTDGHCYLALLHVARNIWGTAPWRVL